MRKNLIDEVGVYMTRGGMEANVFNIENGIAYGTINLNKRRWVSENGVTTDWSLSNSGDIICKKNNKKCFDNKPRISEMDELESCLRAALQHVYNMKQADYKKFLNVDIAEQIIADLKSRNFSENSEDYKKSCAMIALCEDFLKREGEAK